MISKLIATAAIVAAPSAVNAVPCNLGTPNPAGKYPIAIADDLLTEEECGGYKVHLMRCMWLNAGAGFDHASWATMAGYTGVVTGYEWLSDVGCTSDGKSYGGGSCMTHLSGKTVSSLSKRHPHILPPPNELHGSVIRRSSF